MGKRLYVQKMPYEYNERDEIFTTRILSTSLFLKRNNCFFDTTFFSPFMRNKLIHQTDFVLADNKYVLYRYVSYIIVYFDEY